MNRIVLFALAFLLPHSWSAAQQTTLYEQPLSERRVHYNIQVRLDPVTKTLHGTEQVSWSNPDQVPVDELQFHLYLNAFRNEKSTFMREGGAWHRGFSASGEDRWGGVEITKMSRLIGGRLEEQEGVDLTDRIEFIQPDDDNPDDQTVIRVPLADPVAPGETITLRIDFESKLPRVTARTGWMTKPNGSLFFMAGQWFPKLGVYEIPGQRYVPEDASRGQWSTHQFHANSEFYADFGLYEVSITTPKDYTIGATGVRIEETQTDSTQTAVYRAEDVHDFAWTASPEFVEFHDEWRHVKIRLLLQPEHDGQAERHFEAAKYALEYFDRWVGEYPYTTLTLVDGLGGSNGMEYPTLITCGTTYMMPEWARMPEYVTIHEFGHQYFYGMLASNEAEEAWLDEGLTSYLETLIMDTAYGPGSVFDLPGLRISDGEMQRIQYKENNPTRGAIFRRSWEYSSMSEYAKASYSKPVVVLKSLEHLLGWSIMQDILRTYYSRWRFDHPTTRDFIEVVEEVSRRDMDWFFDQFVYGTSTVDYAVEEIRNHSTDPEMLAPGEKMSSVTVRRKMNGIFPQKLLVRFADGGKTELMWDGKEEQKVFEFDKPVVEAYLDPANEVWLDINRLNNRKVLEPEHLFARKQQLKAVVWLQQLFIFLSALI